MSSERLGRGLEALMGGSEASSLLKSETSKLPRHLPIELLKPQQRNPRKRFNFDDMDDLVQSITEKGLLQPLLVRPLNDTEYEIIAGERRWRAAQRVGLAEVPVIVKHIDEKEALELALIENVQRSDLNPLEEAMGYTQLMEEFGYNQTAVAEIIGKSRSHIANSLRLMKLPESVQEHLMEGRLSAGHVRALIGSDNAELLAQQIIDDALNVRETELLAQKDKKKDDISSKKRSSSKALKSADEKALEKSLQNHLGFYVRIKRNNDQAGELKIKYESLEQFDALMALLGVPKGH